MATRATPTASQYVSLRVHRPEVATELQPDDYCRTCREWVSFPNAVFVIGPDDAVQLLCERCLAESEGERRHPSFPPQRRPWDAGES